MGSSDRETPSSPPAASNVTGADITACTLDCPDSCSLLVSADLQGKTHIRGNPDHPITSGFVCRKAKYHLRRLESPQRITTPLLKSSTGWRPIDWEEALDLCAEKIGRYRRDPKSILHFHGEGAKGVLKQAPKLFFAMLGTSEARGSLCDAAGYVACLADFGSRENNDVNDLLNARRIVNWGKDFSRSSIHMAALVKKARQSGVPVLTISPGGDGTGPFTDEFVRIRPGTDRFLAAAAIRLLIERGNVSAAVLERTHGWEPFRELVSRHSLEWLAGAADVPLEAVERVYDFYRDSEPVATIIGAGVQRYAHGGENVRFINALALLGGHIGRSGGGSYFHLHSLRNLNLDWVKDPEKKPRRSLLMPVIGRAILEASDPPVRMIWINGSNVVNQAPDSREVLEALRVVEFKVVVDAFMTDTAEAADLILPCTLMLEQEDIVASYLHDFIHFAEAVRTPPGEARSDHQILSELGRRLDPPVILPSPEECFRAALRSPFIDCSLEELRERRFIRAGRGQVAYEGMRFAHSDGKCRFPPALHEEPPAPAEYPLRLLSLIRRDSMHSQILPEDQKTPPTVWISSENPLLGRLRLDEDAFLVSQRGRIRVKVKVTPGLHPEAVIYRRGDWMKLGGGINQLISSGLTDIGRGAPYYRQYVRLEQ